MIFETVAEIIGEELPCSVMWNWDYGEIQVDGIEIKREIHESYTRDGLYLPHVETRVLDIMPILGDAQISDVIRQIKADEVKRAAEDYDDGRIMDWEWSNRCLRSV